MKEHLLRFHMPFKTGVPGRAHALCRDGSRLQRLCSVGYVLRSWCFCCWCGSDATRQPITSPLFHQGEGGVPQYQPFQCPEPKPRSHSPSDSEEPGEGQYIGIIVGLQASGKEQTKERSPLGVLSYSSNCHPWDSSGLPSSASSTASESSQRPTAAICKIPSLVEYFN